MFSSKKKEQKKLEFKNLQDTVDYLISENEILKANQERYEEYFKEINSELKDKNSKIWYLQEMNSNTKKIRKNNHEKSIEVLDNIKQLKDKYSELDTKLKKINEENSDIIKQIDKNYISPLYIKFINEFDTRHGLGLHMLNYSRNDTIKEYLKILQNGIYKFTNGDGDINTYQKQQSFTKKFIKEDIIPFFESIDDIMVINILYNYSVNDHNLITFGNVSYSDYEKLYMDFTLVVLNTIKKIIEKSKDDTVIGRAFAVIREMSAGKKLIPLIKITVTQNQNPGLGVNWDISKQIKDTIKPILQKFVDTYIKGYYSGNVTLN